MNTAVGTGLRLVSSGEPERFRPYGARDLEHIASRFGLDRELLDEMVIISKVLPFRVNEYVLTHLIDWDAVPDDPMFQMLFPQPGMLESADLEQIRKEPGAALDRLAAVGKGHATGDAIAATRLSLRPHPSGQRELNVPSNSEGRIDGIQHKYEQTVLYFPANGQTCHSYCTYCFRWAQFTGEPGMRFAARNPAATVEYLKVNPNVTDVLVTGGDPLVMSAERLRMHIAPFLDVGSVKTIRIGTKSLSFWPQRFLTDADADATLALFEEIIASGRSIALMAHFSHHRELENDLVKSAIERLRSIGVAMYAQAPLIRHVNDDARIWATMWRTEESMGITPFYMFVARETGPHDYHKVPLDRAWQIFSEAYRGLPGLARTVRGPVMSATAGKIVVDGIVEGSEGETMQLRFVQARDPGLVNRPFQATFDNEPSWITDLRPTAGTPRDLADAMAMES